MEFFVPSRYKESRRVMLEKEISFRNGPLLSIYEPANRRACII